MLIHNDVLVLVESLSLVDVDALMMCLLVESERLVLVIHNDVLVLVESLTLVDVDPLNDVLALVESLTLVDAESLNDVLDLLSLKDSYLLIH